MAILLCLRGFGRKANEIEYRVIGNAIPRIDGVEKVTGAAKSTADVSLPGLLWAKALLSPEAHARIVNIDTNRAAALPGVEAVLTGRDVRGRLHGRAVRDIPILADDRVRHVGERVAAVAAIDEDTAERALELIEVSYEALPRVFDPIDACGPSAPILHPGYNGYAGIREPLSKPSNAYVRSRFEKGDIEQGFAEADLVREHTYVTQLQHAAYLEPQSVVVWDD